MSFSSNALKFLSDCSLESVGLPSDILSRYSAYVHNCQMSGCCLFMGNPLLQLQKDFEQLGLISISPLTLDDYVKIQALTSLKWAVYENLIARQ